MLIGVITEGAEEKKNRKFFKGKNIAHIKLDNIPVELVIIKIKASRKEKKIIKAVVTAIKQLRDLKISKIVLDKELKKYKEKIPEEKGIEFVNGKTELYRCFPDCIRVVARKCGINLLRSKICIRAAKMDRISEYLMQELCYDTKQLVICTNDCVAAELLCERFCEETGFSIEIYNEQQKVKADVIIDINENNVQIGKDVVVDGIEFDFDIEEKSIDMLDVMACLNEFDWVKHIKNYKSSKNRLTLLKN